MKSKKIAILSLPCNPNYGFVLQQWALYSFLKWNNYSVVLLNRRWNRINGSWLDKLKTFLFLHVFCHPFYSFWKKMAHSPEIRSSNNMRSFVKKNGIDTVVVGSDQVWRIENTRGADLNFFGDFLDGLNVKKISYAPSFGRDDWKGTEEETKSIKRLLNSFDSVSVRERDGLSLCKEIFSVEAKLVLDPTMLLCVDEYKKLLKKKKRNKNYVATYILDATNEKNEFIAKIAAGRPIVPLIKENRIMSNMSIEDWLTEIYFADYVVVDSFHGMVFSILFEKEFCAIANKRRGISRFTSLLSVLNLDNRLIYDLSLPEQITSQKKIAYDDVNSRLNALREDSRSFLLNALEN